MCERGGTAAAKPGDGLLCVAGEVQVRHAFPIVLTDVDVGWEVLQEQVDGGDPGGEAGELKKIAAETAHELRLTWLIKAL